ncbi:ATP-binding protein [Streptomyces dysideae]|uniref:ATP-binding protein n=1 Tax=Streptomyces dysideae TaxID=909626 RepID=UPI002D21DB77|nr:ATP-binding protein [Streptomyces dysideae]
MITNAVSHALPPAVLRLSWISTEECRGLRIEVTDAGPSGIQRSPQDLQPEEHGRGIPIVAALSSEYGIHTHTCGTTKVGDAPCSLSPAPAQDVPHAPLTLMLHGSGIDHSRSRVYEA